ncbi:MAG TPA: MFS transporter, partial [Candidatus Polarisedimenticolia bacterium]|nr:MFS transporter [Candidatus Polarisedimenticolia bacterium]
LLVTSHALAAALSAYLLGRVTARHRPGRILAATMSGSAFLTALMLACRTPGQFLVLRILSGLLMGGAITVGYSAGGALIPARRRASLYGLLSSATLMGGAVGPMVSGALIGVHLRAPFVAASLIYVGLVAWAGLRLRDLPAPGKPAETPAALAARPVNQA